MMSAPHDLLIPSSISVPADADILPIHDHGVQRGLSRLVGAPAVADAAVTLLHFTPCTTRLHGIQHRATALQGTPGYDTVKHNGTVFSTQCTGRSRTFKMLKEYLWSQKPQSLDWNLPNCKMHALIQRNPTVCWAHTSIIPKSRLIYIFLISPQFFWVRTKTCDHSII